MTDADKFAILALCEIYRENRNKQKEGEVWDKKTDQTAIFEAMQEAGLTGISAIAGTHMGYAKQEDGTEKLFIVDITDEKVIQGLYKDFPEYWDSI